MAAKPAGKSRRGAGSVLDVLAALAAIGAGIYLLTLQTVGGDSIFEAIAHGLGVFIIAVGVWMARSLHLQARLVDEARPRGE